MKNIFCILILLFSFTSLVYSQDYSRNNAATYSHQTGRSGGPYFAQADCVAVGKPYQLGISYTIVLDTTYAAARMYLSINGDSLNRIELKGSALGGETYTPPQPVYCRYIKLWGNAANLPIRFWLH